MLKFLSLFIHVYVENFSKKKELNQIVTSFQSSRTLVSLFTLICHVKFISSKFPHLSAHIKRLNSIIEDFFLFVLKLYYALKLFFFISVIKCFKTILMYSF